MSNNDNDDPSTAVVETTMLNMPDWIDDNNINLQWLSKRTGITNIDNCFITDISTKMRLSTKETGVKDGATLLLTITTKYHSETNIIHRLIIKQTSSTNTNQLQTSKSLGLTREAYFYSNLMPKLPMDNDLPKIYYSYSNTNTGEKCIIMEYLDSNNWIDSGILFGPGNPNNWHRNINEILQKVYTQQSNIPPILPPTVRDVTEMTFRSIARIHGYYWNNTDALIIDNRMSLLRGYDWIQGNGYDSWDASQNIIRTIWNKYINGTCVQEIKWNSIVRKSVEKSISKISWQGQLDRLCCNNNNNNNNCNWTLVHGDFWPGNVLWNVTTGPSASTSSSSSSSHGKIKLLDWEMVGIGSGPQDLGQYIISNCTAAERRECEEIVLRSYYDELIQSFTDTGKVELINTVSYEYCWNEYIYGGIERWIWFLIWFLGQDDLSLQGWTQYFHNQIADFIIDHNVSPDSINQPRP